MKKTRLNGYVYEFCVDYEGFNPSPPLPLNVIEYFSNTYNYFLSKYKIK